MKKNIFSWAISKFIRYFSVLLEALSSPHAGLFSERYTHKFRGEVLILRI